MLLADALTRLADALMQQAPPVVNITTPPVTVVIPPAPQEETGNETMEIERNPDGTIARVRKVKD